MIRDSLGERKTMALNRLKNPDPVLINDNLWIQSAP